MRTTEDILAEFDGDLAKTVQDLYEHAKKQDREVESLESVIGEIAETQRQAYQDMMNEGYYFE